MVSCVTAPTISSTCIIFSARFSFFLVHSEHERFRCSTYNKLFTITSSSPLQLSMVMVHHALARKKESDKQNDPIPIHPVPHRRSPNRTSLPLHRHLPHSLRSLLDEGIRGSQSSWWCEHSLHGNSGKQSFHAV